MRNRSRKKNARGRFGLPIERLEARDLPTAPTLLAGPARAVDFASIVAGADPEPTDAPPARIPTRRERARQRFVARFSGSFATGPARFTDQSSQIFIKGGGGSNAFLHGDIQMAVYPPADPSGETTGLAALIVKNVTNSGNLLVLDIKGDATSLDRAGRPTRLTWTVDGSSGGTFSGATGEGTVRIRYRTGASPLARSGGVGVIFRGRIETNGGVTDLLRT